MANTPDLAPVVAGILLAAGSASRMGTMKVLLPWHGQPLIRHLAAVASVSRLHSLLVVTGNEADAVADALRGMPVELVHNAAYAEGMAGSLRAGIGALPAHVDAALVMLGDQPLLTAEVIDALIARYDPHSAPIVAPFSDGQRGNPVLFDRRFFGELQGIHGDQGARTVLRAYADLIAPVEVAGDVLADLDTPEAYEALLARTLNS